jgi:hypothetical protein
MIAVSKYETFTKFTSVEPVYGFSAGWRTTFFINDILGAVALGLGDVIFIFFSFFRIIKELMEILIQ